MSAKIIRAAKRSPMLGAVALTAAVLIGFAGAPAMGQVDPDAKADVTGDGTVNILDFSTMGSRFGLQAGQEGYRGGLDLDASGDIGMPDFREVLSRFGTTGAPTTPTSFQGTVFDGLGNRLQGVLVQVGDTAEMIWKHYVRTELGEAGRAQLRKARAAEQGSAGAARRLATA